MIYPSIGWRCNDVYVIIVVISPKEETAPLAGIICTVICRPTIMLVVYLWYTRQLSNNEKEKKKEVDDEEIRTQQCARRDVINKICYRGGCRVTVIGNILGARVRRRPLRLWYIIILYIYRGYWNTRTSHPAVQPLRAIVIVVVVGISQRLL